MSAANFSFERIRSPDNALLKSLKRSLRRPRSTGQLFLEGTKLVVDALEADCQIEVGAFTEPFAKSSQASLLERLAERSVQLLCLPERLLASISTLDTPQGLVCIAKRPKPPWTVIEQAPSEPIVVAAGIQDPGNLGAIARVLEAVAGRAFIATGDGADPFGSKALRGSMGSLLRIPTYETSDSAETLSHLQKSGYQVVAAVPRDGADFRTISWKKPCAILLGNEGQGLAAELVDAADALVSIPMEGHAESLNVATTAALILYEWRRKQS